jgi:hypothetical protein
MFADKAIEYTKHGRSGLRDKDCLKIARNHLFTVNFVARGFPAAMEPHAWRKTEAREHFGHAPKRRGPSLRGDIDARRFYVCLTIIRHC